jgi:hypothetical protein
MARIVTYAHRYKRPPRRKKAVALEGPAIIRAADPAKAHKRATTVRQSDEVTAGAEKRKTSEIPQVERPPANDDRMPVEPSTLRASKSALVTSRRRSRFGEAPDLAPEELQRRRDAADAIMQDFKRQIATKLRQGGGG